jgi:hypothetical protein
MAEHSSQARSSARQNGRGRHRARPSRHLESYNWLGAGAITVSVALGAAFVGGSGIAQADEDAGKPAATASSAAAASTSSGDQVHAPKKPGSAGTEHKKSGSETPASDDSAASDTATTSKVADSQPNGTEAADSKSSDADKHAITEKDTQSPDATATEEDSKSSTETVTDTSEKSGVVAADPQPVADPVEVSSPNPVDAVSSSTVFGFGAAHTAGSRYSTTAAPTSAVSLAAPAALPNPLGLIGAVIAYDLKGAQDLMNPVIAGALGVWHLQTGLNELKTLHLIGGALDIVSGVLALATPLLNAVPLPGVTLLIPVTAVLGSTTATVNTIGQGLLHW